MGATAGNDPKYRHYKPKNLGVVRIDGRDHYLGKYDSAESWEKYHRLLAERHARDGLDVPAGPDGKPVSEILTITEMTVRYYRYCEGYYVKDGKPTSQLLLVKLSIKVLRGLYGSTLCKDFGPLSLEAVRDEFVRHGLSRTECNRRTRLVKQTFKWAVSKELCPPSVYHGLMAVSGLKSGRCAAKDRKRVRPVPEAIVERTIEHMTPTVAAMVRLQLASAMRPGEVCAIRAADLNMAGPIWEYLPEHHKTEHHDGKERVRSVTARLRDD